MTPVLSLLPVKNTTIVPAVPQETNAVLRSGVAGCFLSASSNSLVTPAGQNGLVGGAYNDLTLTLSGEG